MNAGVQVQDEAVDPVIVKIIEAMSTRPEVLIITSIATVLAASGFLIAITYAISKAGRVQPPVVVLSIVTALVALVAIIGVIIRPEVEALAVAAGTAIGALGGALGTAFTQRHKYINEIQAYQSQQDDDDGGPDQR